MARSLVCVVLLLAAGGQAYSGGDSRRYLHTVVDAFNSLFVDKGLYFYTDFGSESEALFGEAQVKVYSPIQLLADTKTDFGNYTLMYHVDMSIDFDILRPPSGLWWSLRDCSVGLDYDVTRASSKGIGVPVSVVVYRCFNISPGHGPEPDDKKKFLSVLDQGLLSAAKEHLSFDADWTTSIDGVLRSQVIGQLMEYAIAQMAPPWLPPHQG